MVQNNGMENGIIVLIKKTQLLLFLIFIKSVGLNIGCFLTDPFWQEV